MMQSLEEQLKWEIAKLGKISPVTAILRKQLVAEQSGQSFQQVNITKSN